MSLKDCGTCCGRDAGKEMPVDGERVKLGGVGREKLGGVGRARLGGAEERARVGGGATVRRGGEVRVSGGGAGCATSFVEEGSCCGHPSSRPRPGRQTGSHSARIRRRSCAQPAATGISHICQARNPKHPGLIHNRYGQEEAFRACSKAIL